MAKKEIDGTKFQLLIDEKEYEGIINIYINCKFIYFFTQAPESFKREAKQIVEVVYDENESFHLEFAGNTFVDILSNEKIKDYFVAVFSIGGEYRMGKSFLLNLFVRYMEKDRANNWTEPPTEKLKKTFETSCGMKAQTKGIWMLNEPIIIPEIKVAIFLIDTQGSFNYKEDAEEQLLLNVFGLLMSSHFILNCSQKFNKPNIDFIKQLTQLLNEVKEFPIGQQVDQPITYLIRDFVPKRHCGIKSWDDFLNTMFESEDNKLSSCFTTNQGYLLPRPGEVADRDSNDFEMRNIDKTFLKHVDKLFNHFVNEESLFLKTVGNMNLTCNDYKEFIMSKISKFQKGKFEYAKGPEEIKSRAEWNEHLLNALMKYNKSYLAEEGAISNKQKHFTARAKALKTFDIHPHLKDDPIFSPEFKEKLKQKIDDQWNETLEHSKIQAEFKNIVKKFETKMKEKCGGITRESVLVKKTKEIVAESFTEINANIPVVLRGKYKNEFVVRADEIYRRIRERERRIVNDLRRGAFGTTAVLVGSLAVGLSFLAPPVLGVAVASTVATELVITGTIGAGLLASAITVFGVFGVVDLLQKGHKKDFALLSAAKVLAGPIVINGKVNDKKTMLHYVVESKTDSKIIIVANILERERDRQEDEEGPARSRRQNAEAEPGSDDDSEPNFTDLALLLPN